MGERMKILFDFLPILLFFGAFKYAEAHKEWAAAFATGQLGFLVSGGEVGLEEAPVLLATVVVIIATLVQVAWIKLRGAVRYRLEDYEAWLASERVVPGGSTNV